MTKNRSFNPVDKGASGRPPPLSSSVGFVVYVWFRLVSDRLISVPIGTIVSRFKMLIMYCNNIAIPKECGGVLIYGRDSGILTKKSGYRVSHIPGSTPLFTENQPNIPGPVFHERKAADQNQHSAVVTPIAQPSSCVCLHPGTWYS